MLRAPHAGVVGDVRVSAGQLVDPGLRMIDLQGPASAGTVIALLPVAPLVLTMIPLDELLKRLIQVML